MKPTSTHLKMAALMWLRFRKRVSHIATECGIYNADVIGADSQDLVEIEVKTSLQDFKADFKNKPLKHEMYSSTVPTLERKNKELLEQITKSVDSQGVLEPIRSQIINYRFAGLRKIVKLDESFYPTHFYFLVPKQIVKEVSEYLAEHYPKYGVMYFTTGNHIFNEHNVRVLRTAKLLRPKGVHSSILNRIAERMSSEIVNLRLNLKNNRLNN